MRGKKEKGITLIALIITIIVMLILVTVTVTTAINGGIFKKAGEAVSKTKDSMKNEQDAVNQLLAEMEKYQSGEGGTPPSGVTPDPDEQEYADPETSYVGCLADITGPNGKPDGVPDGIIYADLAIGGTGIWNGNGDNYDFKYDKVTEKLKTYTVGEKATVINNVEKEVITAAEGTDGADRFYVMSLEKLPTSCYWYWDDDGTSDNLVDGSTMDFSEDNGRKNTETMLKEYEEKFYGEPNESVLWGLEELREKYEKGWFVPSCAEWDAFGYCCQKYLNNPQLDSLLGRTNIHMDIFKI